MSVFYYHLPKGLADILENNFKSLLPKLETITGKIAESIISSIASIPKAAVFTAVTLLSSYFISSDRKKIRNFICHFNNSRIHKGTAHPYVHHLH